MLLLLINFECYLILLKFNNKLESIVKGIWCLNMLFRIMFYKYMILKVLFIVYIIINIYMYRYLLYI